MSLESSFATEVLLVGSDAEAVDALRPAKDVLASFGIGSETVIIPPDAGNGRLAGNLRALIVASPDAALPASLASRTVLPIIRVPTVVREKRGLALLDDGAGNLPAGAAGSEFGTMAIGEAGAKNAALFVVSVLAGRDDCLRAAWAKFRAEQTDAVLQHPPLAIED